MYDKNKSRGWTAHCGRHIISLYWHHVHSSVLLCICPLPTRYSSISAIPNKPILDFSLSLVWAFPPVAHPAASPATLMTFSRINQLIKSQFQWWINLPELMCWSAACCYQSTCFQVIVCYLDVWYYEVYLEAKLTLTLGHCNSTMAQSHFSLWSPLIVYAFLQ